MDKVSKTLDHLDLIRISLLTQSRQLLHQVQTLLYSRNTTVISSPPFSTVPRFPSTGVAQPLKSLRSRRSERLKTWLFLLTLFGIWGWWNSKLLFSTALGMVVMAWVYRLRELPVNLNGWDWYRRLETSQRQLLLAVGSGVSSCVFLYISLSIWTTAENPEMALSVIGQNLGILGILSLIIWQWYQQKSDFGKSQLNQWLGDLTQENSLKRLIAVRQLTTAFKNSPQRSGNPQLLLEAQRWQPLPPLQSFQGINRTHIVEYFQLMLYQENEPLVREALLEGLQVLEQDHEIYS
ncbi:hypothetical protein [Planktothrix serta]|nr:hypothetical protein [Planktothrix serta]